MHELLVQILSYVKSAWRCRWYAIMVAWLVCLGGWTAVYMMPDRYEANARVFVDTQTLLKPLLSGLTVQPNVDQQIQVMSRTLITRPNLEKVLRMADLDIKAKTPAEKEGLIDRIAAHIEFKSTNVGAGNDNIYSLGYWDRDPLMAKRIVQSLLTIFVESSLGDKRKDADQARRFIDEQIKTYEEKLVVAENALKEFKLKHMGLMPSDKQDYYGRLSDAASKLNQAKLELLEAENGRDAMKKQLAGEEPSMLAEPDPLPDATGRPRFEPENQSVIKELETRISSLKQNLDQLRLKYTELHPDIIGSRRILVQLEEQRNKEVEEAKKAEKVRETKDAADAAKGRPGSRARPENPVIQQLKVALADAEATVASMRARVAEYETRYKDMRGAATAIPQVEADLSQLNRDYEINKSNYEKLLARRESAQISENMESSAGGLDFRVIDPPRVPSSPSGPNRPLLISMVLAGGILGGIAFAFAFSQIRPTFSDRRALHDATGLPLLGSVSMIWTAAQRQRTMRGRLIYAGSFVLLLGFYGLIMGALAFKALPPMT